MPQFGEVLRNATLTIKSQDVCQEYVVLKVPSKFTFSPQSHSSLIQPEFTINHQETYGAFKKERLQNFVPPERNSVGHLKAILKTLAQLQAGSESSEGNSEYALNEITDKLACLDHFKSIAKTAVTLEKLQGAFNGLLKSKLLVKSIWSSLAGNVYVNKEGTASLFLENSSGQPKPPAYDALLYIFSLSDEQFRQKHFEDLTTFYFKSLADALKAQNSQLLEEVTRKYAEIQLKTLLPVAKFTYAKDLAETSTSSSQYEDILANLSNYLNYPLIQQEDVYQVIKNYFSSSDYTLLNYKLVPLNEKNGSLGEYFHLIISVKFSGEVKTVQLFAKFLIVVNESMKDLVESGLEDKEDFFYTIFCSLCQAHGIPNFAPKCYLSRLSGCVVLDDLGSLGYTAVRANFILDKNAAQIALKQIAKFHASTVILEELLSKESGKTFRFGEDYGEYLKDSLFTSDGPLQAWHENSNGSAWWAINKLPDLTKELGLAPEKLRQKVKDIVFSAFSKVNRSNTIRNVINHGDLYIANILLKFGDNEAVKEAILIDFQILRYTPPAYEVLFFIFLSTTKETRNKYLTKLLDCYYDAFSACLSNYSLDSNEIYSRKQFDEDANYVKAAAVGTAFCYGHLAYIEPQFREQVINDPEKSKYYLGDHKDELMEILWKDERYRALLSGLMEDFVDVIKGGI